MKLRAKLTRPLWIAAGFVAVGLGLAGVVLPLLPTTPFMILAAFCFAQGSERLHGWLVDHPRFGPAIRDWNRHGAIAPRAKRLAVAAMAAALLISLAVGVPWTVLAVQALVMSGAAAFVLSRPAPPA
ncbi:MAG: YbaN family protein [Rhizobiaceae bacterium]|nr:YbaN family protein [Rhizobiaceae bacterium]